MTTRRTRKHVGGPQREKAPRRVAHKSYAPTKKNFDLAAHAQALGLSLFDLAEEIGLGRRAAYHWNEGAIDPADPSKGARPYIPETSYAAALEFLRKYAESMKGAAEEVMAIPEAPAEQTVPEMPKRQVKDLGDVLVVHSETRRT